MILIVVAVPPFEIVSAANKVFINDIALLGRAVSHRLHLSKNFKRQASTVLWGKTLTGRSYSFVGRVFPRGDRERLLVGFFGVIGETSAG